MEVVRRNVPQVSQTFFPIKNIERRPWEGLRSSLPLSALPVLGQTGSIIAWRISLGGVFSLLGRLGAVLGRLGAVLGGPGAILERSWVVLGGLGAVFDRSWAFLGRSWNGLWPSWAVLRRSWSGLGPSWGGFGAAGGAQNIDFPYAFQYFLQKRCFE